MDKKSNKWYFGFDLIDEKGKDTTVRVFLFFDDMDAAEQLKEKLKDKKQLKDKPVAVVRGVVELYADLAPNSPVIPVILNATEVVEYKTKTPEKPKDPEKKPADGPAQQARGNKMIESEFKSGILKINNETIKLPCDAMDLETLLGKPSKVEAAGVNTALKWDQIGIQALQNPKNDKIVEIAFRFGSGRFDNITKEKFAGKLTIDGFQITAESDLAELARTKTGDRIEQGKRGQYWSITPKGAPEVTIETVDEKGKGVVLVSFSKSM